MSRYVKNPDEESEDTESIFKNMRKTRIIPVMIIAALFLGACSSGEEFSGTRAYRDVSELDGSTEPDIEPVTDRFYTLSEDDRKRVFEAYEILNTVRKDEGLKELKWDKDLEECAYIRAEEITISFDHTRPSGEEWYTIFPGMLLGENICKGSAHADMVMEDWLKNQPDRENFLSDEFTRAAIAVYVDSEGQYYWICEFGNEKGKEK